MEKIRRGDAESNGHGIWTNEGYDSFRRKEGVEIDTGNVEIFGGKGEKLKGLSGRNTNISGTFPSNFQEYSAIELEEYLEFQN